MREKELRIALVCYGGVSLAVYMHGITKEIWRLARASQAVHSSDAARGGRAERRLCARCSRPIAARGRRRPARPRRHPRRRQRGRDQRRLPRPRHRHRPAARPADRPVARFGRRRRAARSGRQRDVAHRQAGRGAGRLGAARRARARSTRRSSPAHRAEIKAKLANFVRAPWFAPPFGGPQLTNLLLDAFDAMAEGAEGRAAAARLPAARPVRHRHRFSRLSRAAPAQFAARGDRDRASAHPRLPGSGRRGAAARRPGRARLRGARDRELPRRLPAVPGQRARPVPRRSAARPGRAAPPSSPAPCPATRRWARPRRRC